MHYVGNPTVDAISQRPLKEETFGQFIKANGLDKRPIIALLAGSRKQEIKNNLPSMLPGCGLRGGVPTGGSGSPGIDPSFTRPIPVTVLGWSFFSTKLIAYCRKPMPLVTSGTATLETLS